jgi:fatty-acid peroxygenase
MRTDLALHLYRDGYDALPRMWAQASAGPGGSREAMQTRLLGHTAWVVRGTDGARLFYDEEVVERQGVVPPPLAHLLFGRGAVHGLDGEAHAERKQLFVGALSAPQVSSLGDQVAHRLRASADGWPRRTPFSLHHELVRVYGTSVLAWAGVEEPSCEAERLSALMGAVVDGFGFDPPAYARAWTARLRLNRWARTVVEEARREQREVPSDGILHALVHGRGAGLPAPVAGVELLNVLRPTVAVAWLGTFAAQALVEHPQHGPQLMSEQGAGHRHAFAQEVRRLAPFVPALAGRVRRRTTWARHVLQEGDLLVLDVPGTNRDPARWPDPDRFRPDRFLTTEPGAYDLVPQGGGPLSGHRCPGEDVALTLLDRTLHQLSRTEFSVRATAERRDRIPTRPARGLRVCEARPIDGGFLALVQT